MARRRCESGREGPDRSESERTWVGGRARGGALQNVYVCVSFTL